MKNWHIRLLGMVLACVLFVLFILFEFKVSGNHEKTEYPIVMFGDSIFGEIRDETSIPGVLESLIGKKTFNAGISGTLAACGNNEYRNDAPKDALSLAVLSKAISYDDFSIVKSEFARNQEIFPYFHEVLEELQNIDYKKTDVIYIEQGVNDYMAGVPIENKQDPYDIYTYKGALRTAIEELRKACPKAEIILCTPTYMVLYDEYGTYQTCEEMDFGGGTLPEYAQAVRDVAKEMQAPLLDNYKNLGIRERTVSLFTVDGIHLTSWAREKMAQMMSQQLSELKKP